MGDEELGVRLFFDPHLFIPSHPSQLFLFPQKVDIHPLCRFTLQTPARRAFVAAAQDTMPGNMDSNLGSQPGELSSSCSKLIGWNGTFDFHPVKTFRKCIIFCKVDL